MRALTLFLSLWLLVPFSGPAMALDATQKVRRERPEVLDTSTAISTRSGSLSASYRTDFIEPPLNAVHSWHLELLDRENRPIQGAAIDLSADMPEHLHGMTTRPVVSETNDPGIYLIRGMNFHMPGFWEVTLDISGAGTRNLLRFNLIVGENISAPDPSEDSDAE